MEFIVSNESDFGAERCDVSIWKKSSSYIEQKFMKNNSKRTILSDCNSDNQDVFLYRLR